MRNGLPLTGQAVFTKAPKKSGAGYLLSRKLVATSSTSTYFVTTKRTASVVSSVATVAM